MNEYNITPIDPRDIPIKTTYFTSMVGEFFVLAMLSLRGYIASLTYGNAKRVDILASSPSGKPFKIEVKTAGQDNPIGSERSQFGRNYEWHMSEKHENVNDPNLYYCFVILEGFKLPRFFIVKSEEVAKYVKWEYEYWTGLERKKPIKSVTKRIFRIGLDEKSKGLKPIGNYENNWNILPE